MKFGLLVQKKTKKIQVQVSTTCF
uniref:Uncharacterized protein n=1 Tax=Rhizophora mucronata TaxID=61149 RepID=A0A2P2PY89_RHIMU